MSQHTATACLQTLLNLTVHVAICIMYIEVKKIFRHIFCFFNHKKEKEGAARRRLLLKSHFAVNKPLLFFPLLVFLIPNQERSFRISCISGNYCTGKVTTIRIRFKGPYCCVFFHFHSIGAQFSFISVYLKIRVSNTCFRTSLCYQLSNFQHNSFVCLSA